jgi:Leucine-rich repeat (LRR) protein
VPVEVGQLSSLTALYLADNMLRALPAKLSQLTALTYLSFFNNQLRRCRRS